jgi:uncharacterized protein YwgA
MNKGHIALKLFLDQLKIPLEVETLDDRKRVQKAVYLGQLTGVDLGYRFGWYIMGPYCTRLTRDYFSLAESLASGDRGWEGKHLIRPARDALSPIIGVLSVPAEVSLSQEDWLELVASLHYLMTVSKLDKQAAYEVLRKEKQHVCAFTEEAEEALSGQGFLERD